MFGYDLTDYIMLELLKNSMRATVEWHGVDAEFPPIKVIIADGNDNEDVVIKVSDEGGGIPRSNTKKIWSYLFTTADPTIQEDMVGDNKGDHSTDSPLAGLGYGLPISRSYCRYFGGDLSIMSMEGYGTGKKMSGVAVFFFVCSHVHLGILPYLFCFYYVLALIILPCFE